MRIRQFKSKDKSAVIELISKLQDFERTLEKDRIPGHEIASKYFENELEPLHGNKGGILIAESSMLEVVGICTYEIIKNENIISNFKKTLYIIDMFVLESQRGQGIATKFFDALKLVASDIKANAIKVNTLAKNKNMQKILSKAGYREYEFVYMLEPDLQ